MDFNGILMNFNGILMDSDGILMDFNEILMGFQWIRAVLGMAGFAPIYSYLHRFTTSGWIQGRPDGWIYT